MSMSSEEWVRQVLIEAATEFHEGFLSAMDGIPSGYVHVGTDEQGVENGVAIFYVPIELYDAVRDCITKFMGNEPEMQERTRDL
jgi:hypothetical protein